MPRPDTRRYIPFCFELSTMALPSEMRYMYSPPPTLCASPLVDPAPDYYRCRFAELADTGRHQLCGHGPVYPGGFSDPRECGPPGMGEICCGPPGMLGIPGVNPREQDTLVLTVSLKKLVNYHGFPKNH